MWAKLLSCSFLIGVVISAELENYEFYTAGAVEYGTPIPREGLNMTLSDSERFVLGNLYEYLKFIKIAKENNVDILVFPEATFNYFLTREFNIKNGIELPNPNDKIAPYEHNQYSEILRNLSKSCKDNQIYVLVNLVERVPCDVDNSEPCKRKDGFNLYNTNVVFDRQGRVISKYQKYNLFMEPDVEVPDNVQYAAFTTDFNVKFGHFICFDIIFKDPAINLLKYENVTNILYPSMWYSGLPFSTAVQLHSGWAYANNVNLISSGANYPDLRNSGSGIYLGRNSNKHKLITGKDSKYLIISKVPKDPIKYVDEKLVLTKEKSSNIIVLSNNMPHFTPIEMQPLKLSERWSDYGYKKWDIENDLNKPQKICIYNDFCCKFDVKFKHLNVPADKYTYNYKLVAYSTTSQYGDERIGSEIYCAIIPCTSNNPNSCGRRFKNNEKYVNSVEFERIKITAMIPSADFDDVVFMPNTLDTSILPLDTNQFTFNNMGVIHENGISYNKYRIESKTKLQNLLTFGIFGRNYALDHKIDYSKH